MQLITINEATLLLDTVGSAVTAIKTVGDSIVNVSLTPVLREHLLELRTGLNRESSLQMIPAVCQASLVSIRFVEGDNPLWEAFGMFVCRDITV